MTDPARQPGSGFWSFLNRDLGRRGPAFEPRPLGPRYELSGPDRLTLSEGRLAGTRFQIVRTVTGMSASFALHLEGGPPGSPETLVAHCHYDRDPASGVETLYDIVVRPDHRRAGLAAAVIRLSLRELLAGGRRHWLRMRRLMLIQRQDARDDDDGGPGPLQWGIRPGCSSENVGIGLVALKLGLVPDPAAAALFEPGVCRSIRLADPGPDRPPALVLQLGTQPGTLLVLLVEPGSGRPIADRVKYERFVKARELWRRAASGEALVGNVDYVLAHGNITSLATRLADNQTELRRYSDSLRRGQPR